MKKLLVLFVTLLTLFSCKYDDLWIKDEFTEIKKKIQRLEDLCNGLNSDIQALEQLVSAINSNEYITEINPIIEDDVEIGYKILFASGKEITIYHGMQGPAGEDGYVPQIGVNQDTDGVWYWTIDGEWMLDEDGNKISTTGRADLVPVLKIEEMFWFISYDGGNTWTKLEKATGEDGHSFFKSVEHDEEYVYITLADGTSFSLPKASAFSIELDVAGDIPCNSGDVITIPYVLKGAGDDAEVITLADGGWIAEVQAVTHTTGKVVITAPQDVSKGQVVLVATNQVKTVVKSITFKEGVFASDDSFILSDNGGELTINLSTNYVYEISTDASWIKHVGTKTERNETLVFSYEALPSDVTTRSAHIKFTDKFCGQIKVIDVIQGSLVSLDKKNLTMFVDEEIQLVANLLVEDQKLVWTSSDSDVAWVSQDGKVVALSKGSATITVMTADYKYSATCNVTVADITDYVYLVQSSAFNVSYSNGMVHEGTQLSWKLYNTASSDVLVKSVQVIDAYGNKDYKYILSRTIPTGYFVEWKITLMGSYKSPRLYAVFEYNNKEYTISCGHMFN